MATVLLLGAIFSARFSRALDSLAVAAAWRSRRGSSECEIDRTGKPLGAKRPHVEATDPCAED